MDIGTALVFSVAAAVVFTALGVRLALRLIGAALVFVLVALVVLS